MNTYGAGWETIPDNDDPSRARTLGKPSGQGVVYLVRSPERVEHIKRAVKEFRRLLNQSRNIHQELDEAEHIRLARQITEVAGADPPEQLGALKLYSIPDDDKEEGEQAVERFRTEINTLKQVNHSSVLKLLDFDFDQRFIVSQFHPRGSLEMNLSLYQGNVAGALSAFSALLEGVSSVHKLSAVHRDIKLANIFVADSGRLILGDFGIVFFPAGGNRITKTLGELVGDHWWMPPWGYKYTRLDVSTVGPTFDIYPLGKLLWSMLSGREGFPREDFDEPDNNLENLFPDDPLMPLINGLLAKCVVKHEAKCLPTVQDLTAEVNKIGERIKNMARSERPNGEEWRCRICGKGQYQPAELNVVANIPGAGSQRVALNVQRCSQCMHIQLFG